MIKFYGLKNCSTCRKAEKWLSDNEIEIDEYIDIRDTPPAKADILLSRAFFPSADISA